MSAIPITPVISATSDTSISESSTSSTSSAATIPRSLIIKGKAPALEPPKEVDTIVSPVAPVPIEDYKVDINWKDYTDKSILVSGETTRDYKDQLMALGGRWNFSLKGYIFSNKKKDEIIKMINEIKGKALAPDNPEKITLMKAPYTTKNKFQTVSVTLAKPSKKSKVKVVVTTHSQQAQAIYEISSLTEQNGIVSEFYIYPPGQPTELTKVVGTLTGWQIWGYQYPHTITFD